MTIGSNFLEFPEGNVSAGDERLVKNTLGLTKEQILIKNLKEIAKDYIKNENFKKSFIEVIKTHEEDFNFKDLLEFPGFLIKDSVIKCEVEPVSISGLNIISVDGSSVVKNFMDVDFFFLKAIAVKYRFFRDCQAKIEYYPDLSGFNNYQVEGNFVNNNENVIENRVSIDMIKMELNLLNQLLSRYTDIDLIILDGPIKPNISFLSKDDITQQKYQELMNEYRNLYKICQKRGATLIGCVKDTRSSSVCDVLFSSFPHILKKRRQLINEFRHFDYRKIMSYFSDIDFFNRILTKSQRSCCCESKQEIIFTSEKGFGNPTIPKAFDKNFYQFYLKSAKYDTPFRIEFFMNEGATLEEIQKKADLISSMILPISNLNDYYGLPIPQIEAHKRAVFKPQEINLLFNNLNRNLRQNGFNLVKKRRNRRPF